MVSLLYLLFRRALAVAALRLRSREFKELEIVVLRHELALLRRRRPGRPAIAKEIRELCCGSRVRTRAGATSGSSVNSPVSACESRQKRSPRSCGKPACFRPALASSSAGESSCVRTPTRSSPATFSRRDALARTPLCALLPRTRHAACAFRRLHGEPRRTLDSPASSAVCLVTLRASDTDPLPDPRSRQQVRQRLRRGLPKRRRRDHPHPVSRTEGKRVRRTLGRHRPPRLPRLAPDQQPQAA